LPIWTTYLGFFRKIADEYDDALVKIAERLKETDPKAHGLIVYFVMRNRGNNEIAPMSFALQTLTIQKDWEGYKSLYTLEVLNQPPAQKWMKERAEEAKRLHVVFVCFEKDSWRCHRRLLAYYMAENYGVDYRAELSTLF